jgi:hypothetical protein
MPHKLMTVRAICTSCNGSGVYCGFMEKGGTGVVCVTCGGTGCEEIRYAPFVARRIIKGVHTVSLSKGRFIVTGVGATGDSVSYQDFLKGKIKYA